MGGYSNLNQNNFDLVLFRLGDENEFKTIFKLNYNPIVGFCRQFIPDKDKAKSLAQEAFIKLWRNKGKVKTINGIRAFLYTAAKSECLNYLRSEKNKAHYLNNKIQEREDSLNREVLASFNFDSLEVLELKELIQKSIDELPEKCKQVFIKSRLEGKKNQEIAEEMGIAIKSVEANMTRALKILRSKLSDFLTLLIIFGL